MGTLSGFIFYANILHIHQSFFLPRSSINVIAVFFAWVNLDLGIDLCFFDGMDSFTKTLLDYVFPLYFWFIVSVIILASRYSTRVAKICGSNVVPVLATIIYLSFTRLLRATILSYSSTAILLPDGTNGFVWYSDGNIGYLEGKHIVLYIFALLTTILFIVPYTLFLTLSPMQWAQALTKYRLLKWINKLKPFLDAHTNHLKDDQRNWNGFLLYPKIISVSFTFNLNITTTLLIITILMFLLIATAWTDGGGVYKTKPRNILDCSFFVNLGILAVSTLFVLKNGGNQEVLFYISGSIALLEFFGIVVFHTYSQAYKLTRVKKWSATVATKLKKLKIKIKKNEDNEDVLDPRSLPLETHSNVSLREPLLDS